MLPNFNNTSTPFTMRMEYIYTIAQEIQECLYLTLGLISKLIPLSIIKIIIYLASVWVTALIESK